MKTKAGFEIKDFKKLEQPIDRHMLEPHIYEGTIVGLEYGTRKADTHCTWDKFGKCSNFQREDCFIDIAEAENETKLTGFQLIKKERQRQIDVEGWTPEHDKKYQNHELFKAAACYYAAERCRAINRGKPYFPKGWPFDESWWKPSPDDRIKELVKAGALYMADCNLSGTQSNHWVEACAADIDKLLNIKVKWEPSN